MARKAFSLKNVVLGILLGLVAVVCWLFYPEMSTFFKTSAPEPVKDIVWVARGTVKKTPPFPKKEDLPETEKAPKDNDQEEISEMEVPQGGEGSNAALWETTKKPLFKTKPAKDEIAPYYAEEEALWQALSKKELKPEYLHDYPYAECFTSSAKENNLPVALVLGLARYFSNFDPRSSMDNKTGIMRLGWPNPSRKMGVHKKEELLEDSCRNIRLGCRLLSDLLSKTGGEWVPALVAYRDQVEVVHPEKIKKTDLIFSSSLRRHVEHVINLPFKKKIMYTLWKFDERLTAEEFMESIGKRSGVALWLGQEGYRYVVYIPAADKKEKREKADFIKRETGVTVK